MIEIVAAQPTFTANIYLGLKEGYEGTTHAIEEVILFCRDYCDEVKLGVTVTPTYFVYVGGYEPGAIIGLIQYPRFPKDEGYISSTALELAEKLRIHFNQERLSVAFPDTTVMLEGGNNE